MIIPALLLVAAASAGMSPEAAPLAQYGTFEFSVCSPGRTGNRFREFVAASFTDGARTFTVDGFYDGDDTWRVRFMPDRPGRWAYSWTLGEKAGDGAFEVSAPASALHHGHVTRDPVHPRYLTHDDGSPHYWIGGKPVRASECSPRPRKPGATTDEDWISDEEFLAYFDAMKDARHNGILLKAGLFPLMGDMFSWDLEWAKRAEWLVRAMGERGIYCQISLLDWPLPRQDEGGLVLAKPGDEEAKLNHIRNMVARFAGFYNVYWELASGMAHAPNPGSGFAEEARTKYLPWLAQYDPYGLALVESGIRTMVLMDEWYIYHARQFPFPGTAMAYDRPMIAHGPVPDWKGADAGESGAFRGCATRFDSRRTFWRMFCSGGSGASEAGKQDLREPLSTNSKHVMADQNRLRDFIEGLSTSINEMHPDGGFVASGPGTSSVRAKGGELYVGYFQIEEDHDLPAGEVTVAPLPGTYGVIWYDPASGSASSERLYEADGPVSIAHPPFHEDIVLVLTHRGCRPEWRQVNAQAAEDYLVPVHPGIPDERPFWNEYATEFKYCPAFDFPTVERAVSYRFTVASDNEIRSFEAETPWASLSPVWRELDGAGVVQLLVEGLDELGGRPLGVAGARTFLCPVRYNGPYEAARTDYHESALRALRFLFHEHEYFRRWKRDGMTHHSASHDLRDELGSLFEFSYMPHFMHGVIEAMALLALHTDDATERAEALAMASRCADHLIDDLSNPAGHPYEFMPVLGEDSLAACNRLHQPAWLADAYLTVFDASGNQKYLDAAQRVAATFSKTQLSNGSWPTCVQSDGTPVEADQHVFTPEILLFLDRLERDYGYPTAQTREGALRWLMEHPVATYDWQSQMNDVAVTVKPFSNQSCWHAYGTCVYLLDHAKKNPDYLGLAEELLRFCEDQFIDWETQTIREQYLCYFPVNYYWGYAIEAYLKAHGITKNPVYLAKARTLADAVVRTQGAKGNYSTWVLDDLDKSWPTCSSFVAKKMLKIAARHFP